MRLTKGDYSISDIKSFFRKHYDIEEEDDIEEGEIIELRVSEYPPVDIVVEVIEVDEDGVILAEIIEVDGETDDHVEGDIIFIPPEILDWD